jgi:hypothetical protein
MRAAADARRLLDRAVEFDERVNFSDAIMIFPDVRNNAPIFFGQSLQPQTLAKWPSSKAANKVECDWQLIHC